MKERDILNKLKIKKVLTKDNHLKFNSFKPFKVEKIYFQKRNFEEVLVLESKGKIFEYWTSQDLLVPPWQTHWFQLKDNFLLKLKGKLLEEFISKATLKAGNLNVLCKKIQMSYPTFYNFVNKKGIEMISILKLRKLLNYLETSYDSINKKIEYTKKGNKISIENPNFPISLDNALGGLLLGMVVSDGCIYIDKKARNCVRTKYSSGEKESIKKFIEIINEIYGKTFIQSEYIRNCEILKIGSSIVGDSLLKAGAILGHKARNDGPVPWLIRYGNRELKRKYLQAVFEDEASLYSGRWGYINLSRYKHLKNLTKNQRDELDSAIKHGRINKFPTGHENQRISVKSALERSDRKEIRELLLNSAPRLLSGESELLGEFGITNRLWPCSLTKTSLGNYSLSYTLFISRKEDILKFYKEIGFSLDNKYKKLSKIVEDIGGKKIVKTV